MEKMLNKKEVYFNEYNIRMENAVYLPIVSGQLQAYAQTISNIKENYKFMPFIFYRDNVNNIILKYKNPNVAAFSLSMWNSELSLKVAEEVKKKFPKCLIIFGGSNIPNYSNDYLEKYSFIDVVVRGEGERTFAELLEANLKGEGFEKILGITYRNGREIIRNNQEQILPKDLDIFPSPYVEGVFDEIMKEDMNFQAIIETDRGCPYKCAYCSWGQGGLSKKYRFFSSERNKQNAEWVGRNKIKYVFCADSNFGIFKEDINTTKFFINAKKKYGFPEIFRVCYSKNSEENVFEIGKLSHENQMEQSITLSFQTLSDDAAKSVGRENVSIEVFTNLQKKYNREGIPTYTELILGLPGETYESFLEGLEKCLNYGIGSFGTENQLYVYHCQIYPNAEMGNIEYQKKHGIKTVRCPLKELHAAPKAKDIPDEYENVVISTNTLSRTDWERASVVAWIMHLLHGLKLGFYPMKYLAETSEFKYTDFFDYISRSSNVKDFPIINKEI
ncbi:MAG: cobalamin-dependent protein, partial [Nanoarchaeota archaeon]|nr:cobalamin-dependent protein [Nanoarchaeota archaeon]